MSYRYDADVLPEEDTGENFILRHWRGHLSLPKSWFLVGGALSMVFVWVLLLGVLAVEYGSTSLRLIAGTWVAFFALFLALRIWAGVGIWRSAGKHVARGGQELWANIARVLLVLGVLASLGQARSYGLQMWEFGQLAAGRDTLGNPARIEISKNKREITIRGTLTAGTADRFEEVARGAPALSSIRLESNGGRIFEAQRLAEYVRSHRLSTRVGRDCQSACTLVLLAGETRYADPDARIGFHQPDFPGFTEDQRQAAIEANAQEYIAGGMDPQFVERAMRTPPNDMWFPSHDELVQARVINGDAIVIGGDPSKDALGLDISATASDIGRRVPRSVDSITRLVGAEADGHSLILKYRLSASVDYVRGKKAMAAQLRNQVCTDEQSKQLIDRGGRMVFRYALPSGKSFDVHVNGCG